MSAEQSRGTHLIFLKKNTKTRFFGTKPPKTSEDLLMILLGTKDNKTMPKSWLFFGEKRAVTRKSAKFGDHQSQTRESWETG